MHRFGAIFALLLLLASALTVGVSSASAAATCYRVTVTVTNLNQEQTLGIAPTWVIGEEEQHIYEDDVYIGSGQTRTLTFERTFDTDEAISFDPYPFFPDTDAYPQDGTDYHIANFAAGPCTGGSSSPIPMINDGRINPYDLGAPVAGYCTADHGIAVWDIDDAGHGTLAFTVTGQQITDALALAQASSQNVLVGQGMGDAIYALPSNQVAMVGPDVHEPGKLYQFLAPADVCA